MSYSRNNLFSLFSDKGHDELAAEILETGGVARGLGKLKSVSKNARELAVRVENHIVEPLLTKTPDDLCDLGRQDEELAHLIIRTPRLLHHLGIYQRDEAERFKEQFAGSPYFLALIATLDDGRRLAELCQSWQSVRAIVLESLSLRNMIEPTLLTALQDRPVIIPTNFSCAY
jgi:hypothetical protein